MKQVKSKLSLIIFCSLVVFNNQVFASGAKLPVIFDPVVDVPAKSPLPNVGTATPNPTPTPVPPVQSTTPVTNAPSGPYLDQIIALANNSSCAKYSWKNRGTAPKGYIKGMSLSFARGICRIIQAENVPSNLVNILSAANTHNAAKDALAHYQTTFSSLNIAIDTDGVEALRALYVLGTGLGMRESSGMYCEGWDKSAGSSRPSSAGEAGLFQTSYDSIGISPELRNLYNEYLGNKSRCLLNVFKEGASCSSTSILGTGAGADYQAFNKACPAFATEYAMTMLRIARSHYGPINRKEAEVNPSCNNLYKSVEELIVRDPQNACDDLF